MYQHGMGYEAWKTAQDCKRRDAGWPEALKRYRRAKEAKQYADNVKHPVVQEYWGAVISELERDYPELRKIVI